MEEKTSEKDSEKEFELDCALDSLWEQTIKEYKKTADWRVINTLLYMYLKYTRSEDNLVDVYMDIFRHVFTQDIHSGGDTIFLPNPDPLTNFTETETFLDTIERLTQLLETILHCQGGPEDEDEDDEDDDYDDDEYKN